MEEYWKIKRYCGFHTILLISLCVGTIMLCIILFFIMSYWVPKINYVLYDGYEALNPCGSKLSLRCNLNTHIRGVYVWEEIIDSLFHMLTSSLNKYKYHDVCNLSIKIITKSIFSLRPHYRKWEWSQYDFIILKSIESIILFQISIHQLVEGSSCLFIN